MKSSLSATIAIACTFLWMGFVCAISFLEAPLKFQAPGITLGLGLGIGRLVFAMLVKIEWILALFILARFLFNQIHKFTSFHVCILIPILILIMQTVWLLPALDARAEQHISGNTPSSSYHHVVYALAEIVKVLSLGIFGFRQLLNIQSTPLNNHSL